MMLRHSMIVVVLVGLGIDLLVLETQVLLEIYVSLN